MTRNILNRWRIFTTGILSDHAPEASGRVCFVNLISNFKRRFCAGCGYFTLIVAIVVPIIVTQAAHADEWTKQDIILESTWQVLQFVDWKQTRVIANHPELYEEKNPIFGSHPSTGKVDAMFAAGALLHVGITHVLPKEYRVYWQAVTIGMSAACVINNYSIGIRVGF